MTTSLPLLALFLLTAAPSRSEAENDPAELIEVPTEVDPAALTKDGFLPLFDGTTLDGWKKVGGTGQFKVEDGAIVGFGTNIRGNTFLRTEKDYEDFILIFEFQFVDLAGNSGCQFRSAQREGDGRVFGYQYEHDNNKNRCYTGGVYDEDRRGWLYPGIYSAEEDAEPFTAKGQELFKWEDWNTIAIRCQGPHIQTWLNGVLRADFEDTDENDATASGFIALQVHGGRSAHLRWRNVFLKEL